MNKFFLLLPLCLIGMLCFSGCHDAPSSDKQTILTGRIKVLVDESLAPIVQEQLEVFQHSYVNAEIELVFMPENRVVNDLINDSAEVVVLTRLLRPDELKFFEARGFKPRVSQFATDAVTLITNITTGDSTITMEEVLGTLRGEGGGRPLIFDNANSGTVRYLKELANIETFPAQGVFALNSHSDVFAYVHDHPGTVGVIGLNWMLKPDSISRKYLRVVRPMSVKNLPGNPGDDDFYLPTQSNLALDLYAMERPVYLINAEPRYGLGMGFAAFMSGERGQRIVLKSGLMPDSLPPRQIIIRKN
ncbi:MAG TPA: substrate-binding domain-containing protein [Sphingobacteriaceae bacterium]|nr:substrate-binding domain-containing protein [Sphingobacteriaceae bacterium]